MPLARSTITGAPGEVAPDCSTSRRRESGVKGLDEGTALAPGGRGSGRSARVARSTNDSSVRPSTPVSTTIERPSGEIASAVCSQGVGFSPRKRPSRTE